MWKKSQNIREKLVLKPIRYTYESLIIRQMIHKIGETRLPVNLLAFKFTLVIGWTSGKSFRFNSRYVVVLKVNNALNENNIKYFNCKTNKLMVKVYFQLGSLIFLIDEKCLLEEIR